MTMDKVLKEYEQGKKLAEQSFDHALSTGRVNDDAGSEFHMYCEAVAFEIRDDKPMTQRQIDAVEEVRKLKGGSFYKGACDFLVGKIKRNS